MFIFDPELNFIADLDLEDNPAELQIFNNRYQFHESSLFDIAPDQDDIYSFEYNNNTILASENKHSLNNRINV